MKKQIIAIDIDDVLVNTASDIISHYNSKWGTTLSLPDWYSDIGSQWGTQDKFEAIRRVKEYTEADEYFEQAPIGEAVSALQLLSRQFELHILTGRTEVVAEATRHWLQHHFPGLLRSVSFSNMFDDTKRRPKGGMCRELGAGYLVDDHIENCLSAAGDGVEAVLFGDYPWNQVDLLPEGVTRCVNWDAVLEYFDERVG